VYFDSDQEKKMVHRSIAVPLFMLLLLVASCSLPPQAGSPSGSASSGSSHSPQASTACDRKLEFAGTILAVERSPQGQGFGLVVHGKLLAGDRGDRFFVHSGQGRQQTMIYDRRKPQCPMVSPSAFQSGQLIRIQSTGEILQSYPAQIFAVEVVIV
jgi:hypothetical protein